MRERGRRPLGQHAGHGRQVDRHLAQHGNVVGQQRVQARGIVHDAHAAGGGAEVHRHVGLFADQRLLAHEIDARLLCHPLVQGGVGLELHGREEAGLHLGVGLPQQRRGELVALPEFVGEAPDVLLPAQRAEQETAIGHQVVAVDLAFARARREPRVAHEAHMQLVARRVDVVGAHRPGLAVDDEEHVGQLHRRADIVDARQPGEVALASQRRQRRGHRGAGDDLRGGSLGLRLVLLLVVGRLARELRTGRRGHPGHRPEREHGHPAGAPPCAAIFLVAHFTRWTGIAIVFHSGSLITSSCRMCVRFTKQMASTDGGSGFSRVTNTSLHPAPGTGDKP